MVEHILLTGSQGFIGSHLLELLNQDSKYEVREFVGDITRREDCVRNLRGMDIVMNLAALTYLPPSWDNAEAYTNVNYQGVVNLLTSHTMFHTFYQQSTSHIYGTQEKLPVALEAAPKPQDPYSIAKLAAERAVEGYARKYGFDYLIARSFNNFGPRQSTHFVIPTFIRQALTKGRIFVRGDTRREFLYVKDNVRVIKALLDKKHKGLMQVCKGEPYRISEIAQFVLDATGAKGDMEIGGTDRPHDIQTLYGDPAPLKAVLPDHTWTPMPQAIAETVDWFKEH